MASVSRNDVIAEARTWLGVPWAHQGRTKQGVDCAGLVIMVARNLGLSAYDTTNYQRRTNGRGFLTHFRENMIDKPVADARPGDVLLFRDKQFPCHSTIVAQRNSLLTIVHAHALRRMVIEEPLGQGDWMERRVACFGYQGLED